MTRLDRAARAPLYALALVAVVDGIGVNVDNTFVVALLTTFLVMGLPVFYTELLRPAAARAAHNDRGTR